MIDEEVRKLVATAYDRAKKILTDNIGFLKELSELLLKTEVVYKEQIEEILGKKKNETVKPIKTLPMQSEG